MSALLGSSRILVLLICLSVTIAQAGDEHDRRDVSKPTSAELAWPAAELVGYWPFDGDGRSEFGSAVQHGEIAATCDRSGRADGAVQFRAEKRGYFSIALGAGGGFDLMKTGTISLWVRWDDGPQTGNEAFRVFAPILSRQQNGRFSTHLLGLTGLAPERAGIRWRSELKCETILEQKDAQPVGLGKWHHVAICYGPNRQTLYVDGKTAAKIDAPPQMTNLGFEPPLVVGGWIGDGNLWCTAAVDDLAIWNEVLLPEQIASLAAGRKTPLEVFSVVRFEDATNYSSLDEANIPREHIRRNPLQAIKFARDTLALVERSEPRPEFKEKLDELERQVLALIESSGAEIAGRTADNNAAEAWAPAREGRATAATRKAFAGLTASILELRRKIVFSHPALNFDRLLINKRPAPNYLHQSRQYLGRYSAEGDGLAVLTDWKNNPQVKLLLKDKLPVGSVLHPDLSFDGKRILFSFCDHSEPDLNRRRFLIYEIGVDGSELRQVTGGVNDPLTTTENRETAIVEDYDPCYLPDGGFMFTSTRQQAHIRCQYGGRYFANFVLHRGELDNLDELGPRVARLSFNEAPEWEPSVQADGSVLYTRWDYINRHWNWFQSLWLTKPDGTGVAHVYGNYTRSPCITAEPRAIPGSKRIVSTAAAHHGYTAGSLILIDPRVGADGPEPITRLTPEVTFPESEYRGTTLEEADALIHSARGINNSRAFPLHGAYCNPYPLSEDLFLVAYTPSKLAKEGGRQDGVPYGIFLLDSLGGLELIYRDPEMSSFAPMPVVARKAPPALPSTIDPEREEKTGVFYVHNVYESTEKIPAGKVKSLRVVEIQEQTVESPPSRGKVILDLPKRILGTVPVEPDGSVAFQAPACKMLGLQLLDENGMAVMGMRSLVYLQPGETTSCIGCHEPRSHGTGTGLATTTSYSAGRPASASPRASVRELTPPAGPRYEGGLSFTRTVQPMLDRYCIKCHGLQASGEKPAGGINLLGTMKDTVLPYPDWPGPNRIRISTAYESLTSREGLVSVPQCNYENDRSTPYDYYSHAGRLANMLLAGHPDEDGKPRVQLDTESFDRIVQWLDMNAVFYGDYSWNKAEWRNPNPAGEKQLRAYIREACSSVFGMELGETLAEQTFEALVNVSLPSESRILLGPLSTDAGGWGTINGGPWKSKQSPQFRRMLELVKASIEPLATQDVAGTCNQNPCRCGTCWVRKARHDFIEQRSQN